MQFDHFHVESMWSLTSKSVYIPSSYYLSGSGGGPALRAHGHHSGPREPAARPAPRHRDPTARLGLTLPPGPACTLTLPSPGLTQMPASSSPFPRIGAFIAARKLFVK